MGNRLKLMTALLAAFGVLLTSCYKQQHFDMPGTAEVVDHSNDYKVPDPFDGSNAVWLIKDGVPDFTKMSVLGFTDFAVAMSADPDALSWGQGTDRNGEVYFGCRQHKIKDADNADNYGGNQLSYIYNALFSRLYVENGAGKQWKMKARVAMEVFGCNAFSRFIFEGSEWAQQTNLGFDWISGNLSVLYLYRDASIIWNLDGTANYLEMTDYMSPSEPFDLEISCVNNFIWVRIGDKVVWATTAETMPEHVFPLMFYPWKGAVRFYDLSIEGDYVMAEPVAVQRENGYVNIQAPALAVVDGTTLLFAEGRHEVMAQTAKLNTVRSNATDIILKRSSDNGQTWSEWTVLKGGDGGVYLRPEVVNAGDKLYLFYTVDVNGKQDGDYRIEYLESGDGGVTWSEGTAVSFVREEYLISTLSGHGIKTSDGKLILPLQCRVGNRGTVAVLYSDDNGVTWNLSEVVSGLRNNAASIAEINGKVVMYISHSSAAASRKIAISEDGGATWSEPVDATIPTGTAGYQTGGATVVSAAGTIYHFTPVDAEKTSLFSGSSLADNPDMAKLMKRLYLYQPEMSLFGKGLTMAVSHDGGTAWSSKELTGIKSYKEYLFPTGAMDAVISGNTVILVTEGGVAVPYEGLLIYRESLN